MKRTPHFLIAIAIGSLAASCAFKTDRDNDCTQYCDLMQENCFDTFVSDGRFDEDACLRECDFYPRRDVINEDGSVVPLGDPVPKANSLECRVYHANNAAATPNGLHCGHAGPSGTDTCIDFTATCGEFCNGSSTDPAIPGFVEFCANTDVGIPDSQDCWNFCNALVDGTQGDEDGNTAHCRLTWALRAQTMGDDSLCENAGQTSPVCVSN